VTRLQARERGVEVDLDGSRWRMLPVEVAVRAGLAVGRELDRPLARSVARELRRSRALAAAGRVLRAHDTSVHDLEQRLAQRSIPAAARAEAVATLQRAGILDDGRFAAARAAALAERGRSDAAIRADLESRGVPSDELRAALEELPPERERAARIVAEWGPGPATARRLAALGFGEDTVESALGGLVADDAA
jgi:SOS response regulatory protein OraA/RecX